MDGPAAMRLAVVGLVAFAGCMDGATGPADGVEAPAEDVASLPQQDAPIGLPPEIRLIDGPSTVSVAVAEPGLDWADFRFRHDAMPAVIHVARDGGPPGATFAGPAPVEAGARLVFCVADGTAKDIGVTILGPQDHVVGDFRFSRLSGCDDPRPCGAWVLHADRSSWHWQVPAEAVDASREGESMFGTERPYDEAGRPMGRFRVMVERVEVANGSVTLEAFLGDAGTRLPMAASDGQYHNVTTLHPGIGTLTTAESDPDGLPDHLRLLLRYTPEEGAEPAPLAVEVTVRFEHAEPC